MGAWYVSERVRGCMRVCSRVCLVRAQCVASALLMNTLALRLQLELEFVGRTAVQKDCKCARQLQILLRNPLHTWACTCVGAYMCVGVWVCAGISMWACAGISMWVCAGISMWACAGISVRACAGISMWVCAGISMWVCI